MKKQILSEELLRMKRLSGIISESQYESMLSENSKIERISDEVEEKIEANPQIDSKLEDIAENPQEADKVESEIEKIINYFKQNPDKAQELFSITEEKFEVSDVETKSMSILQTIGVSAGTAALAMGAIIAASGLGTPMIVAGSALTIVAGAMGGLMAALDKKRTEEENQETIEEVFKNVDGKISVVLSPDLDQDYQLKNHVDMLKDSFDRLINSNITRVAEQKNNPPMWYFNINAGSTLSLGFHLDDVEGNIRWSIYSPVDSRGTTHYIGTMDIENNIIKNIQINDNNVRNFLEAALAK